MNLFATLALGYRFANDTLAAVLVPNVVLLTRIRSEMLRALRLARAGLLIDGT